jgi:membrane-associated phospholipid phosphatase
VYATRTAVAIGVAALFACTEQSTSPTTAVPSPSAAPSLSSGAEPQPAVTLASVEWQGRARGLVARPGGLTPIVAGRMYALLGVAQYGAVVAVADGENDDESRGADRATSDIQRGAVAGASVKVLSYVFPGDAAMLAQRVADQGSAGSPRAMRQFARGLKVGKAVGDAMLVWAKKDGYANLDGTAWVWHLGDLRSGPDLWAMDTDVIPKPTAPAGFQYPKMQPYFMKTPSQFHPLPPPADLTDALNDVIATVNARTPAQAAQAIFWNLNVGSETALGYWDEQATTFIAERRMNERAASHVFALVNAAAMDAVIGCWEAKYSYLVRRPWQVNSAAFVRPMIIGQPNHPSYPSGHSCVSAASAEVLKAIFPSKSATLDEQVQAAGQSRVYAGIHYQFDIVAGQKLGRAVAQWALAYDRRRGLLTAVGLGEGNEEHGEH